MPIFRISIDTKHYSKSKLKKYVAEIFYLLGSDRRKIPGLIALFLGISLFVQQFFDQ